MKRIHGLLMRRAAPIVLLALVSLASGCMQTDARSAKVLPVTVDDDVGTVRLLVAASVGNDGACGISIEPAASSPNRCVGVGKRTNGVACAAPGDSIQWIGTNVEIRSIRFESGPGRPFCSPTPNRGNQFTCKLDDFPAPTPSPPSAKRFDLEAYTIETEHPVNPGEKCELDPFVIRSGGRGTSA